MRSDPPNGLSPAEQKQLRRLRIIAGVVLLGSIVFLVVVDTLGRLLINPEFHADEIVLGVIVGAFLTIIGVESIPRLPFVGRK